jgi:tetratricopeptide (TPR) repeat protein
MSPTNTARYKHTPDEMPEEEFLNRFVVRHEVFEEIFEELKEADYSVPNQHYIMIGQRGQGKTTLLRKLKLEVEKDKKLSKFLLPIKFSEEQYRVRQLCRFWEEVADYLQTHYEDMFDGILDEIENHVDNKNYPVKCFSYLEKKLKKNKKKLLILVDNIDEFLAKIKPEEQHQLREILLTSSSFIIVGGSTKMFEQQYDYSKPFYEFFKIIRLEELSFDESVALLRVLGDEEQSKKIDEIVVNTPERIETLRRVTGGVPRTMVMLFDIFIEDNGNAFDDLMKILDEVTPLYKDRMDDLPPVLQEIVDTIALNWDGMSTKEIAKKTRMESKVVSAQMKQLEKYQMVESDAVGKNKIYIIKERFFNIWYLMRFGRKKDRTRVEWLVKFLLSWYSPKELEEKAKSFRNILMHKNNLNDNYIYTMGEALSYTGCLDLKNEYELKKAIKLSLNTAKSSLSQDVSQSDVELLKQAFYFNDEGDIEKAIKVLVKSKRESKDVLGVLGYFYSEQKEYSKAEEYYLKAVKSGDTGALRNLGNLYFEQKEYSKAEEYYQKAVKSGDTGVLRNLGILYQEQKEYNKAEEYYLKAVKSGDTGALRNLGNLYFEQKEYNKAEKYYLKAIKSGDTGVLKNLGNLYQEKKEYDKAEAYYLKAIKSGDTDALNNLGILYQEKKEYDKAEAYYLKAIKSGDTDALNNLGILYKEKKEYDKAEAYYLKAIKNGETGALRNLGNLYSEKEKYNKAEEYYQKAIKSGDTGTWNSLAWVYFVQDIKRDEALALIEKNYKQKNYYHNTHSYAVILLWHEMFEKSYEKFLEWLEYDEALEAEENIVDYFMLLMAKGQYYKAKEFFELPKYELKARYKPLWYALMTLMQEEFPVEIKKMGSELKETVDEVLLKVENMKEKYSNVKENKEK